MKRLRLRDLGVQDCLQLSFDGAFDPGAGLEHALEPFFHALETCAGEWMPDVIEGKWRRKYTRAALWKTLEEKRDENSTSVSFIARRCPPLSSRSGFTSHRSFPV